MEGKQEKEELSIVEPSYIRDDGLGGASWWTGAAVGMTVVMYVVLRLAAIYQ